MTYRVSASIAARHFGAILLLAAPPCAQAAAAEAAISCPAELAVEQKSPKPPEGFTVFDVSDGHSLSNIQFSDGPPDQKAWLAPSKTTKAKGSFTNLWELGGAEGSWISCAYGQSGLVASRRLPDTIRFCRVKFDTQYDPALAVSVSCSATAK